MVSQPVYRNPQFHCRKDLKPHMTGHFNLRVVNILHLWYFVRRAYVNTNYV
jgi:hypothetical protein